jgi:hypothetical protein
MRGVKEHLQFGSRIWVNTQVTRHKMDGGKRSRENYKSHLPAIAVPEQATNADYLPPHSRTALVRLEPGKTAGLPEFPLLWAKACDLWQFFKIFLLAAARNCCWADHKR